MKNPEPFLSTLKLRDKDQRTIPFTQNWCQDILSAEVQKAHDLQKPCRLIVLKGRQLGVSTWSEAVLFTKIVTQTNANCVVVAHDAMSSEHLFNMTRFFYETWPYKRQFPHKYATKRQLTIRHPQNEYSNLWVMTAEHTQAARGRTIHGAHFSEMAFWSDPNEAMLAFNQAIPPRPGTIAIIESTANGRGNHFHEQWEMAQAGVTDYVPLFFEWWKQPEYIPCFGYKCLDGTCEKCVDESRIVATDDDEIQLVKMGCDLAHLAWRRWAIPNNCNGSVELFHQEYPDTPEIAFLLSGLPAFPEEYLASTFEPLEYSRCRLEVDKTELGKVRPIWSNSGPLRVFKKPAEGPWGQYFIGADPSWGSVDGDFAAAQVFNRHNHEQVAVWHGKVNPVAFADELARLATYYNNAMIACEIEGPGYSCIDRLSDIYPNLWHWRVGDRIPGRKESKSVVGFSSSWKRKTAAIEKLAEMIERGGVILHDRQTLYELRDYAFLGGRGFGEIFGPSSKEGHDDLVMSLAICLICESSETPVEPFVQSSQRSDGLIFGERVDPVEWIAEEALN